MAASATHVLDELDDTEVTYTLAGQTAQGAEYKNVSRALSLPQTLDFSYNIGQPTSKGNDKLNITLKNAVQDANGVIAVGSLKIVVSVPRNTGWSSTDTADLLAQLVPLLIDANCTDIANGMVP
jgi:hypothetical protein